MADDTVWNYINDFLQDFLLQDKSLVGNIGFG